MLRSFLLLFLFTSTNILADILLSSPKIKLNAQDQRVIELKIQNVNLSDGDILLQEYKGENPISDNDIDYTLIKSFESHQTFTIVLSKEYQDLHNVFGWGLEIFSEINKKSLEFAFCEAKLKEKLIQQIKEEIKQVVDLRGVLKEKNRNIRKLSDLTKSLLKEKRESATVEHAVAAEALGVDGARDPAPRGPIEGAALPPGSVVFMLSISHEGSYKK